MNKNLRELSERKKELENELEEIKSNIKSEKLKREMSNGSKLIRVSPKFDYVLEKINEKREEIGLDRLSKPKMCELIIKHLAWGKTIGNDLIHFNINLEEDNFHDAVK